MDKKLMELDDVRLVELSLENPDNFEAIVIRYQDRLFYFIKRISYFDNEDIRDIVQEVFIKTYQNLNGFDQSMKFSTWIYSIARNATIDAIRKKGSRPQTIRLEDEDLAKIFRSSIDIENELGAKDDLDRMRKLICKLPYKYQEVLVFRFLEERTYEEIMDILKKPKGTVAALINRGRKLLLKEVKKEELKIKL